MANPDRQSPVVLGLLPGMTSAMATAQAEIVDFEARTRACVANEAGVKPFQVGTYLNFSRAIYSLRNREIEGCGLVDNVAMLVTRFKAQGCSEPILDKIRNDVWTIPAPAGP